MRRIVNQNIQSRGAMYCIYHDRSICSPLDANLCGELLLRFQKYNFQILTYFYMKTSCAFAFSIILQQAIMPVAKRCRRFKWRLWKFLVNVFPRCLFYNLQLFTIMLDGNFITNQHIMFPPSAVKCLLICT